ncbi:max-binding protein MNT [Genypterus blacodes]|uniref:max-binding protein MNT n=1 Tax=Genypterus blacodes TaxID=154954 RepID=UPI003F75B427
MSIETLLEAAKFLELQAQQQQRAREDDLKEKLRVEQLARPKYSEVNFTSAVHINYVARGEELHAAPIPALPPPPSMPITIIPVPVVAPDSTGSPALPVATLSPPAAPPLTSPKSEPQSPQEHSVPVVPLSLHPKPEHPKLEHPTSVLPGHLHHPQLLVQPTTTKLQLQTPQQLLQCYPGSIIAPHQQHTLGPHPGPPAQQVPLQNSPVSRGSPPDDGRQLDKKRPGGAGTREVHNKLEKHRRAHLKECFETLKKNIPNIDEKKTSNLSVLRSALRYIQTLKRKEKEYEHEMERLAREKIATQQRLVELKNELSQRMDVVEIDRVLRQTVQPEEDQASTSTASEGEDMMDDDDDDDGDDDIDDEVVPRGPAVLPAMPQITKPELLTTVTPLTVAAPSASLITQHISIQHKPPHLQPVVQSTSCAPAQVSLPTHTQMVTAASLHPTVIAHAPVSHASVIQAVNHVIHTAAPKHITAAGSVQLAPGHQPIGHITVHPVAHLSQHLPALYPQPTMVSHITHTLNHAHMNGSAQNPQAATIVSKQAAVGAQMVAHHPQLMGQTVFNPVTMVAMPSFPISTLKLA